MELTEAQQTDIKTRFRAKSLQGALFIGVAWLTLFLFMAGTDEDTGTWFGLSVVLWGPLIGGGMLVGLIGFALSLRCPNCSKSYGRPFITKFCGNCGVSLR